MPGFDEARVLALAALASSDGGQDTVDIAIRAAASKPPHPLKLDKFVPFDPATKMSEATATDAVGATVRVVKGAYAVVAALATTTPDASAAANGNGTRKQSLHKRLDTTASCAIYRPIARTSSLWNCHSALYPVE
jgi:hypothetical protein